MRGSATATRARRPSGRRALAPCALLLAALAAAPSARAAPADDATADDDSAALIADGRRALDRGQLDDAARSLDQALALNPRRIDAYVLRATVHLSRSQLAEGIALLRRARDLAPDNADVLGLLGTMLLRAGDAAEGVPLLEQVARRDPRRYQAQAALGRHYLGTGRWRDAIVAIEAYLAARPSQLAGGDAALRSELADAYLRAGEPRRAAAQFEALLVRNPDSVRARLGHAWAIAAFDCRQARPLLTALAPLAERYPEVWLVTGRCAVATGNLDVAARLAQRVIDRGRDRPALLAGARALRGDVEAARGNFAAAAAQLAQARQREPANRRWPVRLAHVQRRAGDLDAARAALDSVGAPATPAIDPAWWREHGEVLIAAGDAAAAAAALVPVANALPRDGAIRVLLGEALLATGDAEAALPWLEAAEALGSTPRARARMAAALDALAIARFDARDLAGAERLAGRADAATPTPLRARTRGALLLALGRTADAAPPLERAARGGDIAAWLLLGRARALLGEIPDGRAAYARGLDAARDDRAAGRELAVELAIDAAALELDAGQPAAAVTVLDRTRPDDATRAELATRWRQAITTARHAAGVRALRDGDAALAVSTLAAAASGADRGGDRAERSGSTAADRAAARAIECDLAIATVIAGDRDAAQRRLRALGGASCPYPAPADTLVAPILTAFVDGRREGRAGRALDRLVGLEPSATGAAAPLLRAAIRALALDAADEAYRAGRLGEARRILARARKAGTDDAVALDTAVLDVADGRLDAAIAALDRLAPRIPEAWISLGIAWHRKGDPARAVDAWQRARKANVRFGPLAEWIAIVEQVWGPGGSP